MLVYIRHSLKLKLKLIRLDAISQKWDTQFDENMAQILDAHKEINEIDSEKKTILLCNERPAIHGIYKLAYELRSVS